MFTVKVEYASGRDNLLPATQVLYFPSGENGIEELVVYSPAETNPIHIVAAKVYVMNENGRTVAVYNLS